MHADQLMYMANQIGRNLAAQGDSRAIEATAAHIERFWDPRMKAALLASDTAGASPIVAAALALLRSPVTPADSCGAVLPN
jgi:formate dehydrogenase subunit delta